MQIFNLKDKTKRMEMTQHGKEELFILTSAYRAMGRHAGMLKKMARSRK
jgi:hypothetical protein